MLRWARRAEATSDAFVLFCRSGAFVDPHRNAGRYWEYPWAFFAGDPRPGDALLDVGAGYSTFLLHLQQRIGRGDLHVSDPGHLDEGEDRPGIVASPAPAQALTYPPERFDGIFCLSVLEHLPASDHPLAVREMARCLRPGGRLVLTIDHFLCWPAWARARDRNPDWRAWLPGEDNVDIAGVVRASGLTPLDPERVDPHPGQPGFDCDRWIADADLWTSEHVEPGLRVVPIGIALFKELTEEQEATTRFRLAPVSLRSRGGRLRLRRHHGTTREPMGEHVPLPDGAANAPFTVADLGRWLHLDQAASLALVNQLLRDRTVAQIR